MKLEELSSSITKILDELTERVCFVQKTYSMNVFEKTYFLIDGILQTGVKLYLIIRH